MAKTQRERDAEKREEKLRDVQDDVESGSLVIRKMTPAERKKYPAKERKPKPKRGG